MANINTCIIIPCYNEFSNFLSEDYHTFLMQNPHTYICFVNDGSSDRTQEILADFQSKYPTNVNVILLKENVGKAEAVRKGVQFCTQNIPSDTYGFIDADLAVSLTESLEIANHLEGKIKFAFGSRILRIGSEIERKTHRFIIGRFMATLISNILNLKVYDTQCGCKMFDSSMAEILFKAPFTSKWLFDVELFFRFKQHFGTLTFKDHLLEIPLKKWIDRGDSKVSFLYGFTMFLDLYRIKNRYK